MSVALAPFIDPAGEVGPRDPFRAQIATVARRHGPIDAASVAAQTGEYFGGCSLPGANCFDEQAIIFLAPTP